MDPRLSIDWDNIRVFLAALRAKSLRGVADELGLTHPTARRRLAVLEEQLGLKLFERRRDGLHPTVEAHQLEGVARSVEAAMHRLGRVAQAVDPALNGPIRVTAPHLLISELLMPDLVAFQKTHPGIELRVEASYDVADLERREADVALRAMPPGVRPAEHLTGRLAAVSYKAVYGRGDHWIGWHGGDADRAWIEATPFPTLPVIGAFDDAVLQRAACAAGLGLTTLPCYFAEPLLERRSKPTPQFDVWVLVHPDLRQSPRLRKFRDAMVAALKRHQPRLKGES